MVVPFSHAAGCKSRIACEAYTLIEILMTFLVLTLVMSGIIYGYVQANRMAEFSSMLLAGQSYASQGVEAKRDAKWDPYYYPYSSGPNSPDELPMGPQGWTNWVESGSNYILDIPIKGQPSASDFPYFVTNYISISNVYANPPLRQIRCDAVWTFPLTGQAYTNTMILLRAGDQ